MSQLSDTINLLGRLLGDVIAEHEGAAVFDAEERFRNLAKARRSGQASADAALAAEARGLSAGDARSVAAAFALYFDLVNLAEDGERVRALRRRERDSHPEPYDESVADAVGQLKRLGVTADEMADLLSRLEIELVLTAHPTESKRRTLLSKLGRVGEALSRLDSDLTLPRERADLLRGLRAEVSAFWLTERTRSAKPAVTDEVRTGLYYVEEIFWTALPRIAADLDAAVAAHYPGLAAAARWLTLASWIGGDRDGNPFVTAAVTAETLRLHRGLAVERHRRSFQDAARRLSLSARRVPVPAELTRWLDSRRPFPSHAAYLEKRYIDEPYRLTLALLAADLEAASQDAMAARLMGREPHQALVSVSDLAGPLNLIAGAVPDSLVEQNLRPLRRALDTFGLQPARLDLRQDSERLNAAVAELLRALGLAPGFENAGPAERAGALAKLLMQPRPIELADHPGVTADSVETWATFRLLARGQQLYGRELFGPFIISMTRSAADVLAVLLLARWAGCDDGLSIVPLFETMDDLANAPAILADLFGLEVYRRHLASCSGEQMVMIGYSDSNKDGGYAAATWALYQAQESISQACRQAGVGLTFFHGRGGTVARGGGPANRAIRAQPEGTLAGRFRVTEQGETIASRYGSLDLAHRHLEQIVSAVLLGSAPGRVGPPPPDPAWRAAMDQMARTALAEYRALVFESPGFLDFWHAATPIDEISRLRIGSRPASRRGGAGLEVGRIRAIPWVFSWMQSRFNLPGWYGLGTALDANPEPAVLAAMYAGWPFFQALIDNAEMSLLKADMAIAALYVELVPDRELARTIFARLRSEFERAEARLLAVTGRAALLEHAPVIRNSIERRNPYIDPLNYLQVEMLARLRALPDQDGAEAEALRDVLVFTINGIASGLKNTG